MGPAHRLKRFWLFFGVFPLLLSFRSFSFLLLFWDAPSSSTSAEKTQTGKSLAIGHRVPTNPSNRCWTRFYNTTAKTLRSFNSGSLRPFEMGLWCTPNINKTLGSWQTRPLYRQQWGHPCGHGQTQVFYKAVSSSHSQATLMKHVSKGSSYFLWELGEKNLCDLFSCLS